MSLIIFTQGNITLSGSHTSAKFQQSIFEFAYPRDAYIIP